MSIEPQKPWITAKEAARILRVSERQVGNYAKRGDIAVLRHGRNVRYSSEDVAKLADTLESNSLRHELPAARQEANEQLVRYVQERAQIDQQYLETQRDIAQRLERIAQRIEQPPKPSGPDWKIVSVLALVLAITLIVLVIVLQFL